MQNSADNPRPWATAIDATGTAWPMRIDLGQAMALRASKKLDLLGTNVAKVASDAANDTILLIELAYILTAKQRATHPTTIADDLEFVALFDGDTWTDLVDATMEAIIDFIPPQLRPALHKLWTRQKAATARGNQHIVNEIAKPETTERIDREVDQALADFDRELRASGPTIRS